jgi:hypothetical protein
MTIDTRSWRASQSYAPAAFTLQKISLVVISVKRLSRPQDHSAAGRIMSMKNSSDAIGNRTRDLPACSAAPHPTAPPRAALKQVAAILVIRVVFGGY